MRNNFQNMRKIAQKNSQERSLSQVQPISLLDFSKVLTKIQVLFH